MITVQLREKGIEKSIQTTSPCKVGELLREPVRHPYILTINGHLVSEDVKVYDGDTVIVYLPPMAAKFNALQSRNFAKHKRLHNTPHEHKARDIRALSEEMSELNCELLRDLRDRGDREAIVKELADVMQNLRHMLAHYDVTEEEWERVQREKDTKFEELLNKRTGRGV